MFELIQEYKTNAEIPKLGACVATGAFTADEVVQKCLDLGIKYVRRDLMWDKAQPTATSVPDFSSFDILHNKLKAKGITTLLLLGKGNAAFGLNYKQPANTDASRLAWEKYMKAVVTHYGSDYVVYELFNEPNLPDFWFSGPNPKDWATLCNLTAKTIRAIAPKAVIVTGGLAAAEGLKATEFMAQAVLNGLDLSLVDAVGTHPYSAQDTWNYSLDRIDSLYIRNKNMSVAAKGKPVWGTEAGIFLLKCLGLPSATIDPALRLERQGELTDQLALAALAWPQKFNIFYELMDDGVDKANSEAMFGFYDRTKTLKPAGKAFKRINDLAVAATALRIYRDGDNWKYEFDFPTGTRTVTWNGNIKTRGYSTIGPLVPYPVPVPPPQVVTPPVVTDPDAVPDPVVTPVIRELDKHELLNILQLALDKIDTTVLDLNRLNQMVDDIKASFQKLETMRTEVRANIDIAQDKIIETITE